MTVKTWMPLYIGDYLKDTTHLSAAEHGAYLKLMMRYWADAAPLPDDDEALRRVSSMERAEWKKSRSTIRAFFSVSDGLWRHKRIDEELSKAEKRNASSKEKAKKAAASRWSSSNASSNASSIKSGCLEHASSNAQAMPINGEGEGPYREGELSRGSEPDTDEPAWVAE